LLGGPPAWSDPAFQTEAVENLQGQTEPGRLLSSFKLAQEPGTDAEQACRRLLIHTDPCPCGANDFA
jgi:hypothetical protein